MFSWRCSFVLEIPYSVKLWWVEAMAVFFISRSVHGFFIFHCYIRQEKDGLLSEAVKSFNGALAMDRNQQTAKDHLEKIQLQINLKKEVGGDTYVIFTYFLRNIFPRDTAKRVFQRNT